MPPPTTTDAPKSWKKINEERKALKKKRKQERLLKELEKLEETDAAQLAKTNSAAPKAAPSTISIAVPGSILENAQSAELRSYVAGQIARAACIFRVHEVIVFDDIGLATARETKRNYDTVDDGDDATVAHQTVRSSCLQLARILQYLECPQYLRKFFFPLHKDLKYSGLLNPLDTPHHLRQQNVFLYREGIIAEKKAKDGYSYVNVGLLNDVLVDKAIAPGVRVTVKLENLNEAGKKLRGTIVSPEEPRRETGIYWGYTVRIAHSLAEIFTKSPYDGGYDLTIGTSDRGANVHEVPNRSYDFNHLLIVFGGLKGLETALANDDKLTVDDPSLLFDHYVNVLPRQGSRTIRTEEALLIALAALQEKFKPKVPEMEAQLEEFQLPRSEDTGMQINIRPNKKQKKRKNADMQEDVAQEQAVEVEQQPQDTSKHIKKQKLNGSNPFKDKTTSPTSIAKSNFNDNNPFKSKSTSRTNDTQKSNLNGHNPLKEKSLTSKQKAPLKHETAKNASNPSASEAADDFEIVPAQTPKNSKSFSNAATKAAEDLSRFD